MFDARGVCFGKRDGSVVSFASIACSSCLFDFLKAVGVDFMQVGPNPRQNDCAAVDWLVLALECQTFLACHIL